MYHSSFLVGSTIFPRARNSRPVTTGRDRSESRPCTRGPDNAADSRPGTRRGRSASPAKKSGPRRGPQQRLVISRGCARHTTLSITDVPQVRDPSYQPRPPTRSKSTAPPSRGRLANMSRPHTVASSRPRTIQTARTWHYGKPPPKEAHAAVIDWDKARLIKAPIVLRRARSSHSCRKENVERTEVSIIQPYPVNYNAFLVQTLTRDLRRLYTPPPELVIKAASRQNSSVSSEEDDVSLDTYWKMT